jgi:hypothetical protein
MSTCLLPAAALVPPEQKTQGSFCVLRVKITLSYARTPIPHLHLHMLTLLHYLYKRSWPTVANSE